MAVRRCQRKGNEINISREFVKKHLFNKNTKENEMFIFNETRNVHGEVRIGAGPEKDPPHHDGFQKSV